MNRVEPLRTTIALAAALALLGASGAAAQARPYRGPHPIDLEGHWHLEEAVHVHDELPVGSAPFGEVEGVRVFLADPVAYGWPGEVWTFRGAHPLPGGLRGYCAIGGEHRHPFAPEGSFRRDDGVYVFTGAMRGGRDMVRPARLEPRHPVVTAERPPVAPFGVVPFGACPHRLVWGPDGPVRVPLPGCRRRAAPRRSGPGRRGGARPAPSSGSWFDGNYSRVESRPAVRPDRPRAAPSQGRTRRR